MWQLTMQAYCHWRPPSRRYC